MFVIPQKQRNFGIEFNKSRVVKMKYKRSIIFLGASFLMTTCGFFFYTAMRAEC